MRDGIRFETLFTSSSSPVIAIDTNLLVYAHRQESPFHLKALATVSHLAEDPQLWAIPWPCIHEFLAIVTHPRIFSVPSRAEEAWEFLNSLMESPTLHLLNEAMGYPDILRQLLISSRVVGPKVHDARIAGICLNHGVQFLWTADRDFARFPTLKTHNPLV